MFNDQNAPKNILSRNMDILISNLLSESVLERFDHHILFFKNGFLIAFSKSDLGGGADFVTKKFLKKPNKPEYAQVLVVTCPKLNSVAALLPPPHSGPAGPN